jgi:hypothetical protein
MSLFVPLIPRKVRVGRQRGQPLVNSRLYEASLTAQVQLTILNNNMADQTENFGPIAFFQALAQAF